MPSMTRGLVDALLVRAPNEARVSGRYDEALGYTVDGRGRPLVVAETHEITEVAGEHDEPGREPGRPEPQPREPDRGDQPDQVRTFAEREVDDVSGSALVVYLTRTETSIAREQPDRDGW
jgi:hypothetical protein